MIFPQPIMRLKPLTEMGIPEATLMRIYRTRGQKVAKKISPGKRNRRAGQSSAGGNEGRK